MKKIFIAIAVAVAALALCGVVLSRIAESEIRKSMENAQGASLTAQKVHLSLLKGNLEIRGLEFAFQDSTSNTGLTGSFDALKLSHIHWGGLFKKTARFSDFTAENGEIGIDSRKDHVKVTLHGLNACACDIRYLFKEHDNSCIEIDSIKVSGDKAVLFQDYRIPPSAQFPTIQESINAIGRPININSVNACFKAFSFILETTNINRGILPMHNVQVAVNSVSNSPDNVMDVNLKTGLPGKSRMDFSLKIHNDKPESTTGKYLLLDLDATKLDGFVRPLFGATVGADVHSIGCSFTGDKSGMNSRFCMQYNNLKVHAWDDSSAPYRIVADNSGIVNFLANLVLPNANPIAPGKEPKEVEYTFKRDPMRTCPEYLLQSAIYGAMHTILPGSRIHKK